MASSLQTLERRLLALEGGYGETIYQLRRDAVGTGLNVAKIVAHLGLVAATDEDIDAAIEAAE